MGRRGEEKERVERRREGTRREGGKMGAEGKRSKGRRGTYLLDPQPGYVP